MSAFNIFHIIFDLILLVLLINSKRPLLVSAQDILAAWKNAPARFWSHPRKSRGRPPLPSGAKQLVLKMKKENPSWSFSS